MSDAPISLDSTTTTPAPMAAAPVAQARAEVERIAHGVAGTGVAVAAFAAADGSLLFGDDQGHPFFSRHAFPAFAAAGPAGAASDERRVPGVRAAVLPSAARRNPGDPAAAPSIVLFARCEPHAFADPAVAAMAAAVPTVDATLLDAWRR